MILPSAVDAEGLSFIWHNLAPVILRPIVSNMFLLTTNCCLVRLLPCWFFLPLQLGEGHLAGDACGGRGFYIYCVVKELTASSLPSILMGNVGILE